jgi:hypothetical protein
MRPEADEAFIEYPSDEQPVTEEVYQSQEE